MVTFSARCALASGAAGHNSGAALGASSAFLLLVKFACASNASCKQSLVSFKREHNIELVFSSYLNSSNSSFLVFSLPVPFSIHTTVYTLYEQALNVLSLKI